MKSVAHGNENRTAMTQSRNLITDVPGLRVGNAGCSRSISGLSVLLSDRPMTGAVDIRGGGPGTRDTAALGLEGTVDAVHAIVLSGGSAFALSAATRVQTWLAARGIGFPVGNARVPIVPQAVLFDLLNGGDKSWADGPPYDELALLACQTAALDFDLGSTGAGLGATCADTRGGLGSASACLDSKLVVGALVAANPVGQVTIGDTGHFWAAPFEQDCEFGGLGPPNPWPAAPIGVRLKGEPHASTTLAVVATNARLDKRQCHRLAVMAQTGLARAIRPVHTPLDGDTVFAVSAGDITVDPLQGLARLGAAAADCLSRAIARGVYCAAPAPEVWTGPAAWISRFGPRRDGAAT